MSIWLRIDCTLRISWSACCRRASSLSYSSRSYSFEDIVSTHRWSIAVRRLSLHLTCWLEILDNRWIVGIVLFWKISVTHLIWILSTCSVLVLIYSTQIKFFVYNSWILKSSSLSRCKRSLHRIVHNIVDLSFNLRFGVPKLQADLSWWLWLIIRLICPFLIHVSSGAINDTSLRNSIIHCLVSVWIHSFTILGINRLLFWNMLICSIWSSSSSLMVQVCDISHSVISVGRVVVAILWRRILTIVSSLIIWIVGSCALHLVLDVLSRIV